MLNEIVSSSKVYIVTGYTDMRKGIDGLAQIIGGKYEHDIYSKSIYLFCGRSCSKIKGLVWDEDGFLLLYKRLENGSFKWPRSEEDVKLLTQQLRWLLEGLDIEQRKAIKPGKQGVFY